MSFGSGSSGNCYLLKADDYALLIDLGVGIRTFKKCFKEYGQKFSDIKGILVTHDHTDHVKAVGILSCEYHLPVYATEPVHEGMARNYFMKKKVEPGKEVMLVPAEPVEIGPFRVTPFQVPHDSSDNVGYFIECENVRFCLITDAGQVTDEMKTYIRRATHLVMEANYDDAMLATGPYPQYLQDRIRSGRGHMSNADTALILAENLAEDIKNVWLCHLSEENNHPELARKTIESALWNAGFLFGKGRLELEVLKRKVPSKEYFL